MNNNWVSQIKNHRKKVYSQCGEEGFIEFILQNIGVDPTKMTVVEFGAGDGVGLSNSEYFRLQGASCLRFDGDPKGSSSVNQLWLNHDEVKHIAITCNATKNCDVLMVDVDGNDYWFIKTFLETIEKKPSLVVCEINPIFKRYESFIMPYNETHTWQNNDYYGMSLSAIENLMSRLKYTVVFVNDSLNAYFVPSKLVEGAEPEISYRQKQDHPHDGKSLWYQDDLPFHEKETNYHLTAYPPSKY